MSKEPYTFQRICLDSILTAEQGDSERLFGYIKDDKNFINISTAVFLDDWENSDDEDEEEEDEPPVKQKTEVEVERERLDRGKFGDRNKLYLSICKMRLR